MERAFVNVLENARRYSGGHPVSVRARAVRSLAAAAPAGGDADGGARSAPGDRVIVRIVDRGPGIPPAQLERVFEPFYRARTPSGEHRGSGLGLAIARGFAEANAARCTSSRCPARARRSCSSSRCAPSSTRRRVGARDRLERRGAAGRPVGASGGPQP